MGVGLYGLLPEPQSATAPVPKVETVKEEDITADRLELLDSRRVQREIKMTAEQRAKLLDGLDELRDNLRADYEASERIPDPNAPPRPVRNFDEVQKEFYARRQAFAATAITPKQFARFLEMEVQLMGEFAPMDKRVAEKMKLSDKQKGRVIEMLRENEDFTQYQQQVVRIPNNEPRKVYKTPAQMREAVEKELTAAQRKVWGELAGEKLSFDVDKNQSDFSVRGKYRVMLRPEGYKTPGKGDFGR